MGAKDDIDALMAQADVLRARLLDDRLGLLRQIEELDNQLARLPGADRYPPPINLDEWRRRRQIAPEDIGRPGQTLNSRDILHATASYFGMTVAALKGPQRFATVTRARHVAMYLARKLTGESFPELGMVFGSRDHTSIIAAVRKIEGQSTVDPQLRADLVALDGLLRTAESAKVPAASTLPAASPAATEGS